jgi:hypothetical protein
MVTEGLALMVTGAVGLEEQPVDAWVYVNVAVPGPVPVTTPPLVTLAIAVLLLDQAPPDEGDKVVVVPVHIELDPNILTTGLLNTVIGLVALEIQPVEVLVKTKVALPA